MTPGAPIITVGITCFNAVDTIERALAGAAAQDWPHFEILVVDDASADDSAELVEAKAMADPRIRLIRHETNKGCAEARNTIVANARGDFIAFFDDDDESHPNRIRVQVQRIQEYEGRFVGVDTLCYAGRIVHADGATTKDMPIRAIGHLAPEPHGREVADFLFWDRPSPGKVMGRTGAGTLMARRSLLKSLGRFDPTFRRYEDWDMAVRAALRGCHFISPSGFLMTQHITQAHDKAGRTSLDYAIRFCRKHKVYLRQRGGYLAALAIAHAHFHGSRAQYWRGRLWMLVACFAAPHIVLRDKIGMMY